MAKNDGTMPSSPKARRKERHEKDTFELKQLVGAFTGLPRVLRLVWSTSPLLTFSLALLSLLQGFAPVVSVVITKLVIDSVVRGIRVHSPAPVFLPVGLQLAILLITNLLSALSNIIQQLLQVRVSDRIQLMILEKANTLDLAFFENHEFYDKMREAADESSYKPVTMISQLFTLLRTLVTLLSMLGLLLSLAWWLAIVALIAPIPSFISSSRYGWRGYMLMRRQSPERRSMQYLNMILTTDAPNKEIKLFTLTSFFTTRFHTLAEKFYRENREIVTRRYLMGFVWTALTALTNSAIYLYVALQAVLRPAIVTLGSLSLYTQAAVQTGQNFQGVLDGIASTYENNLYVNNVFEFLDYEPRIVSPPQPQPIVVNNELRGLSIEFRNISFTYPGKQQAALKNVSFTIQAGEAVALVGRNGAGKTTIVKLLTRLYDPDEGEVLINGRNIKEYALQDLREQIGVIFQDFMSYHLNAHENIGVGRVADIEQREMVEMAARKSGASEVIERLESGYDTMLGRWFKDGVQLSGGEWQKVALARAFMRDARILVLDEPTSALDAQAEADIFAQFRTLTEGKTAIFISHRFSTVRLADRIIVIEHGILRENGSHEELMELNGRYAELFNLQAEAYR